MISFWQLALVLRIMLATVPDLGLPQLTHISCQKSDFCRAGSTCSDHPGMRPLVDRNDV